MNSSIEYQEIMQMKIKSTSKLFYYFSFGGLFLAFLGIFIFSLGFYLIAAYMGAFYIVILTISNSLVKQIKQLEKDLITGIQLRNSLTRNLKRN